MQLLWTQLPSVPDAEGFASPFAGIGNDALLVGGGANFPAKRPWEGGTKIWYDTVFALPSPDGAWRVAGRLPRPCAYGISVTHGGGVICAGGGDAREHFRDVYKLKWNGGELAVETLPALPRPCAFSSGALVGDVFYLAGGIEAPDSTRAMHTFWALDLTRTATGWRELPPWPGRERMLAVAAGRQKGAGQGGEFYLFSGVALRSGANGRPEREPLLADGHAYDIGAGVWRRVADMAPRVAAAAATPAPVAPDGSVLVCTGDDGTKSHLNGHPSHPGFPRDVLAYKPDADKWEIAGKTPFSRATVPTVEWHGKWIVVNGERLPGYRSPDVWALEIR
ncbi:hypothetical protein OH491_12875 [Termitidicoccus mucosus]|uniref:Galactose oxidase n=1 Tax=Termitidicoccus mucosus TaxID=1184151 RepID=A0A178IHF6_9BACT|nr:hypothetical protein AW736_14590 [Opitutaceae bacterium TSB47]